MKRTLYRVRIFGTWYDSPSLVGALAIVASMKATYGPACRVTMIRFTEER
jgi:hypothetical protein